MKRLLHILLMSALLLVSSYDASAQRYQRVRGVRSAYWGVDSRGDSTLYVTLLEVRVFHRARDLRNYQRMVRAVKKVYPLAVEAAKRMENLDQELAKLEKRKDRKEGKILLKLIDRETNHTVFGIIKDFRSGFTAGFYQALAKLFGNNLKLEYDPEGEDEMLEYIVKYYKAGIL